MADIFISYASEDRSRIEPLAKALVDQGWSVFWDRTIPAGKTWREVIGEALENAHSVIVAWSKTSVKSRWVQEEADWGFERKILIPIFIEDVRPPLGFGTVQARNLINWDPSQSSPKFEKLISDLSTILGPSPLKVKKTERNRSKQEHRRKQEEKRKHQEVKTETDAIVPSEPKPSEPRSLESRKKSTALKFGIAGGVFLLLVVGIYWGVSQQRVKEIRQKMDKIDRQALYLANAVVKLDKLEQIEEFLKQKNTLSNQVEGLSSQVTKIGLKSDLEQLQNRLDQIQIQLANKKKELIATRKAIVFVESVPDNSSIKILDVDEPFRQGMELEPGKYHVQVSSEGYETERKWIVLEAGHEEPIKFELTKISARTGRLFVETAPSEASVKILNIGQDFQNGMELEPGSYHVEAAAEGYEPKRRWIVLVAGHEEAFRFELIRKKVITNSIGMKFVLIPKGKFVMGSPRDEPGSNADEKKHRVILSKPFYLQITEVSQGQWKKVMKNNPSKFQNCGDDCPVEGVSWYDTQKFMGKLDQIEGINKYRLPTEAEWEYACRAKTDTAYSFGNEVNKLGQYAWYTDNSVKKTHPVGKKEPNTWGLYDMHGNVWEWCQDRYDDYPSKSVTDPKGPTKGRHRVMRGGSWDDFAWSLRSAIRFPYDPVDRSNYSGFRVARDF